MTSEKLSEIIVHGMQEKKGEDIVVMDMRSVKNAVADYFIICTGNSDTQLDALSESVEYQADIQAGEGPYHKEGKENKEWILIDYVDVVAHIFKKDRREYFALEDLWGDAKTTHIDTQY